jgi:ribosomal protein S18 acetylase RimI-like enzyme
MGGNYQLHLHTLPQVPSALQIEGEWPESVTLRRGWARGNARPWNPLVNAGALRLVRGNSSFLAEATAWVAGAAGGSVLSPALYPSAARIWERSGYSELLGLKVMEKAVAAPAPTPDWITTSTEPDLAELEKVDRSAFDRFWHMGRAGLSEAFGATPKSMLVEARTGGCLLGYAMLGNQAGVCFVQRIAVDPDHRNNGIGGLLMDRSEAWAAQVGAGTMILNVRPDNEEARRLYRRKGFRDTGTNLHVLSYQSDSLSGNAHRHP